MVKFYKNLWFEISLSWWRINNLQYKLFGLRELFCLIMMVFLGLSPLIVVGVFAAWILS